MKHLELGFGDHAGEEVGHGGCTGFGLGDRLIASHGLDERGYRQADTAA